MHQMKVTAQIRTSKYIVKPQFGIDTNKFDAILK